MTLAEALTLVQGIFDSHDDLTDDECEAADVVLEAASRYLDLCE